MTADSMSGKNPFEAQSGKALHGTDLLGPVIPAGGPGGRQGLFFRIPGQMIPGEQESIFPEQTAGSGRMTGNGNDPDIRKRALESISFQENFDVAGIFREVRFMEDSPASKMPVKSFVLGHIVFVCQEHPGDSSQFLDPFDQGFGESGRIDQNVSLGTYDQVACRSIAFGRMVTAV